MESSLEKGKPLKSGFFVSSEICGRLSLPHISIDY
jgi:hypothetical protein